MSNPNNSPTEPTGASGQPKEPEPVVNNGLQDERRGWRRMTKFRGAKKMDPSIFPADQLPWTFHLFGDLPLEIRLKIWRLAWPPRAIWPYQLKPAHQIQCRSRQPCRTCRNLEFVPPVRAPAVMQVCREARIETQRISKPIVTWLRSSQLPPTLRPSWSRAQSFQAAEIACDDQSALLPIITPFNSDYDVVYFSEGSIESNWIRSGPPNHDDVLQHALDPEVPLMVDAQLFDGWEHPSQAFNEVPNQLEAFYHHYLQPRKHVYVDVGGLPALVLTDEGWKKAIQEGLFSGHYLDSRLVPIDDVRLIRKYEALRHYSIPHTMQSRQPDWDQCLWTGDPNHWHERRLVKCNNAPDDAYNRWVSNRLTASRENLSSAQLLMLQIADFLMWKRGSGDDKGEEIMDLDGQFKSDHPLVQQEGLRMPKFTAVLFFQAAPAPRNDLKGLYSQLSQVCPKYPEEDSSRLRLSTRRHLNNFLGRWGKSL